MAMTVVSFVVKMLVESVVVITAVDTVVVRVHTVVEYVEVTVMVVLGIGAVVVEAVTPTQEQALEYRTEPEHGDA